MSQCPCQSYFIFLTEKTPIPPYFIISQCIQENDISSDFSVKTSTRSVLDSLKQRAPKLVTTPSSPLFQIAEPGSLLPSQAKAFHKITALEAVRSQLWPLNQTWATLFWGNLKRLLFDNEKPYQNLHSSVAQLAATHRVIGLDMEDHHLRLKAGTHPELRLFEHLLKCCQREGCALVFLTKQRLGNETPSVDSPFSRKTSASFEAGTTFGKNDVSIKDVLGIHYFSLLQEILLPLTK